MAGTESNRDLISRILQESDDDDDDEIDRIIIQNLRKKQAMPEASVTNLVSSQDALKQSRKDNQTASTENENSGSSFTATSTRLNYSSASKSKIDNILRDLANDSSSDDDVGINIDEILKKEHKKKQIEKDINNRLNMSLSDDSDDEENQSLVKRNLHVDQEKKDEEDEKRLLDQISKMTMLEIIEQNEKKTEEHKNYTVFQYDKNYYNIHKIEKKLVDQQRLTKIAEYLYNPVLREYDGLPYCIRQYKNLIFVGISQGLVRVFDYHTDEELKPLQLKKSKTTINRVLCMDVSLHGEYLVAGYANGNIALFDIQKSKWIIEITEVHFHEIEHIKFLSIDSPISFMTGDKKGILYKISVSRSLLMYSYKNDLIMKKPFKEFCSLSALSPFKGMPKEVAEWHIHNIVAFANTEELNVAVLGSSPRKLFSINRNEFAKGFVESGNLWYTAWGYGITPIISREKAKCLLAVAWGKVLQIYILENPDKGMSGIRSDGYYICDNVIDWIHFVSDSIVMILVNKKEIRILYIPHFLPNSYAYEGHKIKEQGSESTEGMNQIMKKKSFGLYKKSPGEESLREHSLKAELESGTSLLEGNLRYSIIAEKQNFSNTITVNENNIIVLGQEKVLSAKLFHWEDYLKYAQKQ